MIALLISFVIKGIKDFFQTSFFVSPKELSRSTGGIWGTRVLYYRLPTDLLLLDFSSIESYSSKALEFPLFQYEPHVA
jgi:hypothetical protein